MNYLSIDLWDKRCGLAYSTFSWIIFMIPYCLRKDLVWVLKEIIKEKNIDTIVIWLPFDLYWINKKQLQKTESFIEKLKNIFPKIKIDSIDERFTTFEAMEILSSFEKKEDLLQKKDSMSAYLILERYLGSLQK